MLNSTGNMSKCALNPTFIWYDIGNKYECHISKLWALGDKKICKITLHVHVYVYKENKDLQKKDDVYFRGLF